MKPEYLQNVLNLIADNRKNIADHLFQGDVNSPFLKQININNSEIERLCREDSDGGFSMISHRAKLQDSDKVDLLKIAYAMSRFDYQLINAITDKDYNQTEAFNYLERVTGVKATTLKNMRDRFDPYLTQTRSKRKGWHQAELLPEYEKVIKQYTDKNEQSVMQEIAEILDSIKKRA